MVGVCCCYMCMVGFLCEPCIGAVLAFERNRITQCWCVCVAVSGWSTAAACCIIIVFCPSPHTSIPPTVARGSKGKEREGGGRMNEPLNELYCVCSHACAW